MQKYFLIIFVTFLLSWAQISAGDPVSVDPRFSEIEKVLTNSNDVETLGRLFNELKQVGTKEEFEAYRYLIAIKYYFADVTQKINLLGTGSQQSASQIETFKNTEITIKEGEKKIITVLGSLTDQDAAFIFQDNPDSIYLRTKNFSWLGFSASECPREQYEDLKKHLGLVDLYKNYYEIFRLASAYEAQFMPKYSQHLSVVLEKKQDSDSSFVRSLIVIAKRFESLESIEIKNKVTGDGIQRAENKMIKNGVPAEQIHKYVTDAVMFAPDCLSTRGFIRLADWINEDKNIL